jgi:mRNA interferase YafQ
MPCQMTTNSAPYTFLTERGYQRKARKFFRQHPDLRPAYDRLLVDLAVDPFAPALKLHPLSGRLKGIWAISLTYSYRITLTLLVSEKEITLLDIGDHDEMYR